MDRDKALIYNAIQRDPENPFHYQAMLNLLNRTGAKDQSLPIDPIIEFIYKWYKNPKTPLIIWHGYINNDDWLRIHQGDVYGLTQLSVYNQILFDQFPEFLSDFLSLEDEDEDQVNEILNSDILVDQKIARMNVILYEYGEGNIVTPSPIRMPV